MSFETGVELVELVRKRVFTVVVLLRLHSVILLMPCHMLLAFLVLNCPYILFLYCRLTALMVFRRS